MELTEEYMAEVRSRPGSDNRMTNFDHTIDEGLEEDLRNGMQSQHYAWDHHGLVWYDNVEDVFYEEVRQYHEIVAVISNKDLRALMEDVNDLYGWG